jgi:hypothetical protein
LLSPPLQVDVEYYSTASLDRCRVLLSPPLQADVEFRINNY